MENGIGGLLNNNNLIICGGFYFSSLDNCHILSRQDEFVESSKLNNNSIKIQLSQNSFFQI